MKIIGHDGSYGYIVELSYEDMSALSGEYRAPQNRLSVGTKVDVCAAFRTIRAARESRGSVEKSAKLLHAQAEALSSLLLPIIEERLPDELKAEVKP